MLKCSLAQVWQHLCLPSEHIDDHISNPSQLSSFLNHLWHQNHRSFDGIELGSRLDDFRGKLAADGLLDTLLVDLVHSQEASHHIFHSGQHSLNWCKHILNCGKRLEDPGKLSIHFERDNGKTNYDKSQLALQSQFRVRRNFFWTHFWWIFY